MRNRIRAVLLATGAALAVGLTAAPSYATAMTWTVSPGGAVTGTAGTTKLTDTTTGFAVTCTGSSLKGTLKSGSGLPGTGIGTISGLTYTSCAPDTLAGEHFPWRMNFTSLSKGVVHGTFTGGGFLVSAPGCSATVSGTISFGWTLGTNTLKLLTSGSNLRASGVTGCFGQFGNGDPVTYTATYKMPHENIS